MRKVEFNMKTLRLNRHEEKRILGGHLWIYSNEVDNRQTPLKDFDVGEQVLLESSSGKTLGSAYVNPHSLICARLINRDPLPLDHSLLQQRLQGALSLRRAIYAEPYYRLVFGESDLLPGLVVDRFGPHLCVQINTAGMEKVTPQIIDALQTCLKPESILLRNDSPMRTLEGLDSQITAVYGSPPEEVELVENTVRCLAPLFSGQKTGWFFDQRSNRKLLTDYVVGKRVLDVFSYIGGFAVQAAVFGAEEVWAVDSSRPALLMAEKNAELNGMGARFTGALGDAFDVLKALHEDKESFDVIVVDPPAFIKRKKDHREGLKAYHHINELAIRLLRPGGFLLSASCSMHLGRAELMDVLRSCSKRSQRHIQIVAAGGQGADHPVHPAIPETFYLKAFLARVM